MRIYPDKVHLDSHEIELTPDERDWGEHYWQQDWLAGSELAARSKAWDQLATRFGAARAAWIARSLAPTNAAQRPSAPSDAGCGAAVSRGRGRGRRSERSLASPGAGAAAARSLDRGRAIRRTAGARGGGPRHRAPARGRPRSESRTDQRNERAARHRCRHAVDGRFRCCRSGRHGFAHTDSGRTARGGSRQSGCVRQRRGDQLRRHRGAGCGVARRASLHRRSAVPAARHADQQHRRPTRRLQLRRSGPRALASRPRSASTRGASTRVRTRFGWASRSAWPTTRSPPASPTSSMPARRTSSISAA